MRTFSAVLLTLALSATLAKTVPAETDETVLPIVELKFSGYQFGQSPAANMICQSGYCKSQAPGGDGLVTHPFSTYTTPGAVTTLSGLTVVNPRYTFWDDQLYRIHFQVDCSPLEPDECHDDIVKALDHEYTLTPLSANETRQYVLGRHVLTRDFITGSGAFVKIRLVTVNDEPAMPMVDVADKGVANHVGSTISPTFKPKRVTLPEGFKQP